MMQVVCAESSFATIARDEPGDTGNLGGKSGGTRMRKPFHRDTALRPACSRLIGAWLLALMGALAAPRARAEAVPLSVYGALPSIEDVAISPDGSRLADVLTQGDLRIVAVSTVADRKMIRWVKVGDEKLRDIGWADNDNLLITTSLTTSRYGFKEEWYLLRVYNVPRNEIRALPGATPGVMFGPLKTVVGPLMVRNVNGHTVIFLPGLNTNDETSLFRCDLTTGLTSVVRATDSSNESWLVDAKGDLAAQQDYDEQAQRWTIGVFHGTNPTTVASGHAALDQPDIVGFGPTADTVIVWSIDNGRQLWHLLSLSDGKITPMPQGTRFNQALADPLTGLMIGGIHLGDRPRYGFLNPLWNARWQAIVKAFEGDGVELVSYSSDFSQVVVLVDGPNFGYCYVLIDLNKNGAAVIGKVYAGLEKPLATQRITYAAADGLQIPAYLTLPAGRAAHDLPLIVLPHGGPAVRDTAQFDWWSQALAAQGYAVLRPNYRGSDLGEQFLSAGYGQWGRKMQTDLSDGVRYLVKQGIADPARVCIVGASYGGYAALAGITLDPTVYRCAVSVAGISDLARMLRWEGRGNIDDRSTERYWDRFWGASGPGDPILDTISPIKHIAAVKAPVLLIHGRDDTVVPYEQSQIMFDALRAASKPVELVTLKHEDHWLSRGETRLQMLQATVDFLRKYNPPD